MSHERASKWDRAARYLRIAAILHAHPDGVSARQIARQIGVSVRTVYRDLDGMSLDAALPIWQDRGRWGLESGAFLPPLALTLHEAMALFLAARVLTKANDEGDTELIGALVKLAQVLPPVLAAHIQSAVDNYALTPANERFTRVFRALTEAWANSRVVELEYDATIYDQTRSARRARVRPELIEPSALMRALYLIGFDEERGARRTFKVERILDAAVTPETFEPLSDGMRSAELAAAWDVIADQPVEAVELRFTPAVARRVAETRWHPSQRLEELEDGSLLWRGRVAGLQEIRIWILGWGPDVEVLEPASLRDQIAADVTRAAKRYSAAQP